MIKKQVILVYLVLIAFVISITGCTTQKNIDSSSNIKGGQGETMISNQITNNVVSIITIKNSAFIPDDLKINPGTTVRFINQDSVTHTIKSDTINSLPIGSGQSFDFKFDALGTYEYICGIHPSMKGRIIVI